MSSDATCSHTELEPSKSLTHSFKCKDCGTEVGLISQESVDQPVPNAPSDSPLKSKRKLIIAGAIGLLLIVGFIAKGSGTSVGGVSGTAHAADFITASSRNMMRLNGLDAYDATGNSITLAQFAQNYLSLLDRRLGTQATADQVSIGLESGNSLNNMLHQFFVDENAISVVGMEMQKDAVH